MSILLQASLLEKQLIQITLEHGLFIKTQLRKI